MTEELKEMLMPELGELRVIVANKNAELADRDAELADRDAKLADRDAKLADRDAEIALLKRMLAEANNQNMKSL